MATLSPADRSIIEKYPLSGCLDDDLQDLLRSTEKFCDAADDDSDIESKKATSMLLFTLIGSKAGHNLVSPTGSGLIKSDLGELCAQFHRDELSYKNFRLISRLILGEASDVDIWSAIFRLIRSIFTTYFNRFSSSGSQSTSEDAERVRNVVKRELNSNLELDQPKFVDTYFPKISQVEEAAIEVFKKCSIQGRNSLYNGTKWRGWKDNNEKSIQRSIEKCVNTFTKFLDETGIKRPSQRWFVTSHNILIPGSIKRKPDLCVATSAGESTGMPAKLDDQVDSWDKLLVVVAIKSSGKDRSEKTWCNLAKCAREIFRFQDSRRFWPAINLTVRGAGYEPSP